MQGISWRFPSRTNFPNGRGLNARKGAENLCPNPNQDRASVIYAAAAAGGVSQRIWRCFKAHNRDLPG